MQAAIHGIRPEAERALRIAAGEEAGKVDADLLFRMMDQDLADRRRNAQRQAPG